VRAVTTPLTSEQAIERLRQNPKDYVTPETLRSLAAQVDADASGKLTVLYSGPAANGVWSTEVINAMTEAGEDVRVINKSQAAQFLTSRDFYSALAQAYEIRPKPLIHKAYLARFDCKVSCRFVDQPNRKLEIFGIMDIKNNSENLCLL
jgi:hypothetical protein